MNIKIDRRNMFYGANSKTFEAARILRRNMTLPELILWKRLKNRKLFKTRFRRQHPIDIFIVDFYCHEYKLVIEIDGEIHYRNEVKEYDLGRSAEIKKFGINIIRFKNEEIISNIDDVIIRILNKIDELSPL